MYDYLSSLLYDLDGVKQSPKYHPEGDALFHSLQVFQLAREASDDPILWAAALFHDVGKAVDSKHHARIGGEMLSGVLNPQVTWLVEHHLDLMHSPRKTRKKYGAQPRFAQLQKLRRFDVNGRDPAAQVISVAAAIESLQLHHDLISA